MWPVDSVQFARCFETLSSFPNLSQQSKKSNSRCAKCGGLVNASELTVLNPTGEPITSGLPVIRPRSVRSAEITPYKAGLPGLNAPGVRFVIGSLPLTDGARPSRDVKTIITRSADGRIQNYSRGGHHDSNQCYTKRQRAGRCNSSV